MRWMILPLRRYAQFTGRSRRREFWMWSLFIILAVILLSVIDSALDLGGQTVLGPPPGATAGIGFRTSGGLLTMLFVLAILLPNLAVQVRRLHDINRGGWWLLLPIALYLAGILVIFAGVAGGGGSGWVLGAVLSFAGFIAAVVLLVFLCLDGTRGPNRFGPDPKGADLGYVFA